MTASHLTPEEYREIAEKIKSGEYFREARGMYDLTVHDPMAERYFYLLITGISCFVLLIALLAMQAFYPLSRSVPFIVSTNDIAEDLPRISSLVSYKGETASEALLRFMVQNYVNLREEYDISTFEASTQGVQSQSSNEVAKEFLAHIDPHNPDSPVALYQRHSSRAIYIVSTKRLDDDQEFGMEIVFDAVIVSKTDIKKSRWQANIGFDYSGVELDAESSKLDAEYSKVKPVSFVVTRYQTKRLQDIR